MHTPPAARGPGPFIQALAADLWETWTPLAQGPRCAASDNTQGLPGVTAQREHLFLQKRQDVLVSRGCCNKLLQTGWLETSDTFLSPSSGGQKGHHNPTKGLRGGSSLPPPAPGGSRCSWGPWSHLLSGVCLCPSHGLLPVSPLVCSFYKDACRQI